MKDKTLILIDEELDNVDFMIGKAKILATPYRDIDPKNCTPHKNYAHGYWSGKLSALVEYKDVLREIRDELKED